MDSLSPQELEVVIKEEAALKMRYLRHQRQGKNLYVSFWGGGVGLERLLDTSTWQWDRHYRRNLSRP